MALSTTYVLSANAFFSPLAKVLPKTQNQMASDLILISPILVIDNYGCSYLKCLLPSLTPFSHTPD